MCCGKNRASARSAAIAAGVESAPSGQSRVAAPIDHRSNVIMFELVRGGATVVRGPASGRAYRFDRIGDRVRVDARDRPALLTHPALRWVRQ